MTFWRAVWYLFLFAEVLGAANRPFLAVRAGKLWDGEKVIAGALVVIENGRVRSVAGGNPPPPEGATVIDWSRYTALPGLIDVHTHITYYWDRAPGTRPLGQDRLPAITVFLAQENARKTLEAGVTTARDLGASDFSDIAMRELINRGAMVGPRLFVSAYGLSVTRRVTRPGVALTSPGTADGVAEVVRVVRQQIAAGADVIKMYGSLGSYDSVAQTQTFTFEEMKAAVDTAHAMGKRIAIHSYGPEGGQDAVRAGADSLEHATGLDEATLAQMARRGTFYVPTIDHNRYYIDAKDEFGFRPSSEAPLRAFIESNLDTARRAVKAGVRLAMGSDAVYTMFGQNTRELGWFVKAGMTPEQALRAATVHGALLLGMEKQLGRVAPGYLADMVAIEGDPLAQIDSVWTSVRGVIKDGDLVIQAK